MNHRFRRKLLIAKWISRVPFGRLRVMLYRVLLGYRIGGGWIGMYTVIAVDEFVAETIQVGIGNKIIGPFKFRAGKGVSIGHNNEFSCENWVLGDEFSKRNFARILDLGDCVMITSWHFIDVVGQVRIGEGTWCAGRGSQIWSHGLGVGDVLIGSNCYLGSAVRICPGSAIADDCVLAMGSVLTKRFGRRRSLIGGIPAKVIKDNYVRPSGRSEVGGEISE